MKTQSIIGRGLAAFLSILLAAWMSVPQAAAKTLHVDMAASCSFSGNSAVFSDGAIHISASSCTMTNCIVWHNAARERPSINAVGNCSHCLIEGWNPGGSCIDGTDPANNPLFASPSTGDLRLLAGSPALDSGDNAANPLPSDIAGNPRIQNDTVDLGAFEGSLRPTFSLLFPGMDPDGDENADGQTLLALEVLDSATATQFFRIQYHPQSQK